MATDVMGNEDSVQDNRQRAMRANPGAGRGMADQGRPAQRASGLGSHMREVVRETVFATYDALRGRYDR